MSIEEISTTSGHTEVQSVNEWPAARVERVARGLGRSQMIGRYPDGLPITERTLEIEALMKRNRQIAELGEE